MSETANASHDVRTPRRRVIAGGPLATLLLFAVLGALALAACSSGSSPNGAASPTGTPKRGGTLTLSYLTEPSSLDPAVAFNLLDVQVEHAMFDGFFRYVAKPGSAGTVLEPDLATEVPSEANGGISADGRTFTIHLRKGVSFQAPVNREVTAADFKYSFQRMLHSPLSPGTGFYMGVVGAQAYYQKKASSVSGFKVVNPLTIQIDLTSPDLSFLHKLAMQFCDVVPREWVAKWGKAVNRHPLGTGPFAFDHWTSGQEIVLKRNSAYWDKGKPYLDEIDYKLSYEPSTALLKLQAGQLDALGDGVPTADLLRVRTDPKWKSHVYSQPLIATTYLFMNMTKKPFDDIKVRQALSWAVDRDRLVKLQSGQAVSLYQIYPQNLPGSEPDKVYYGYDPAKAKALLAEAGYPDGFKTELATSNVDPMPKLVQSVQADLKAIGVDAEIKTMDRATYYTYTSEADKTAMGTTDWFLDFPDPVDWIVPFFTKANAVPGGLNASYYVDPWVETATDEAQAMTDAEARLAKYTEIQQHIMEQAPYITLYSPVMTTMCSKNVGGFYLHPVLWFDPLMYWRK